MSKAKEAAYVYFRTTTQLSLEDCLYFLQESIPHLKRSNLHRVLQNHWTSKLPKEENETPETKKFKEYPISYFHLDIAHVNIEEGRLFMFVAIDRTSKNAYVELHDKSTREVSVRFLETLVEKVPYTIYTILTDNGNQFTSSRNPKVSVKENESHDHKINSSVKCNAFDTDCSESNIKHKLTLPYHPWTNGQVERMNRTIKEATVKKYHYETHDKPKEHIQGFIDTYNFANRLKTNKVLTIFDLIDKCWQNEPAVFKYRPDTYLSK